MHIKWAFTVLSSKFPEIQNSHIYRSVYIKHWGWRSWLGHCPTRRKVAGSIQDGVIVWDPQLPENLRACPALYRDYFTFTLNIIKIVLVNDQPDAQFFSTGWAKSRYRVIIYTIFILYCIPTFGPPFICLFQFSTCFEQPHAHHQENQLYQYNIWYMSLCVGGRVVCRSRRNTEWHTPDVVLIQLILLMMSTRLFETCRELK